MSLRRVRHTSSLVVLIAAAACGGPKPFVVTGAGVFDGTGTVFESGRIVIIEGRVTCVGAVEDCAEPPGADVLDADGFWVIPGLIDADAGIDEGPRDEQPAYLAFVLGITTTAARDGPAVSEVDGAEAIRGQAVGSDDPRIPVPRPASTGLDRSFGVFGQLVEGILPLGIRPRESRELGIWSRSRWAEVDPDILLDSARAMGARGVSYAPRLLEQELWAGPYRFPGGLHMMLDHPIVIERIQDRLLPDRTESEAERITAGVNALRGFVGEFHDAGGTVVAATGGVLAPGLSIHEEMDALVTAGLSPEEAIYAATRHAAEALGLDDRGTLEVGKLGDLVIIEGDPRLDIALTQTVSRVVKGGVMYDPPTLFDALLDSPGERVTDNPIRLWLGGGMLLLTLLGLWGAVIHHRRSLETRPRPVA